jgi:hypothetical protein
VQLVSTSSADSFVQPGTAEVLRLYEDTILEVEQQMGDDPAGGLPDMQYQLAEMQVQFPSLAMAPQHPK